MPRYLALLRGVNVGNGRRVPMAEFKALLQALGGTEVNTLLNSGNAVFNARARAPAAWAGAIADGLRERLGVQVPVIVKTAAELAAAAQGCPWNPPEEHHARLLLAFGPDAAALQPLGALQPLLAPGEAFAIGDAAAYLYCPGGLLDSAAGAALLGRVGRNITTRNWATVRKLVTLAG